MHKQRQTAFTIYEEKVCLLQNVIHALTCIFHGLEWDLKETLTLVNMFMVYDEHYS